MCRGRSGRCSPPWTGARSTTSASSRSGSRTTFRGLVAFGYFHPVICALLAAVAMYVTTEPAHEIESGLVDLELARALPRHRLLTRSLLLAVATIAGGLVLMFAGTSAGGRLFG